MFVAAVESALITGNSYRNEYRVRQEGRHVHHRGHPIRATSMANPGAARAPGSSGSWPT